MDRQLGRPRTHKIAWKPGRMHLARRPRRAALPSRKRRRRVMAAFSGVAMCFVLPVSVFQIILYRQNLAMARERLPAAPVFTAQDRILVLSPHCDDETLGVGGTLEAARAAGARVRVVFLTNGDGSRSTQIAEDARHPRDFLLHRDSFQRLAAMRQRETVKALGELGIPESEIVFLGYPDGGTQQMWEQSWSRDNLYRSPYTGTSRAAYANARTPGAPYCGVQALHDVTAAIAEWRPTVIFTTHPNDTHPDHWAAYAYARAAVESLRLRPASRDWAERLRLMTFLVHRGLWPAPHGYHPEARLAPPAELKDTGTEWVQAPLARQAQQAKWEALERYHSQLEFTPQFLRGFVRRNELFGLVPINACSMLGSSSAPLAAAKSASDDAWGIPTKPIALVRDATRDSILHDVWPAGDLESIAYYRSPGAAALTLRLGLVQAPSSRLSYRLALHDVTATDTSAWTVTVRWRGTRWRARVRGTDNELPVRVTPRGFDVDLVPTTLQLPRQPAALMVSASTYLGSSCFDQTATGTLRLQAPVPGVAALFRSARAVGEAGVRPHA